MPIRERKEIAPVEFRYHHVYSLNNAAGLQLASGDLAGASETFARALQTLKGNVSRGLVHSSTGPVGRMLPRIACAFLHQDDRINFHLARGPLSAKGQFIHEQPIELYLPCNEQEATLVPETRIVQILSFSVVYNLALCRHMAGMQMDGARGNLLQAAQLYSHAQTLLAQHSCLGDHGVLHGLAILNNLGSVFYRLGNEQLAKQHYENLFRAIVCVKTSGVVAATPCLSPGSVERDHVVAAMDNFLSNILSHWNCSPDNAPAA